MWIIEYEKNCCYLSVLDTFKTGMFVCVITKSLRSTQYLKMLQKSHIVLKAASVLATEVQN